MDITRHAMVFVHRSIYRACCISVAHAGPLAIDKLLTLMDQIFVRISDCGFIGPQALDLGPRLYQDWKRQARHQRLYFLNIVWVPAPQNGEPTLDAAALEQLFVENVNDG